jgi:ribosomal protein S18 acetylase RimI-like enzyme
MPTTNLTIRPFELSDLPRYIPLRLEALRDNPAAFASSYEDQRHDSEDTWRTRTQRFLDGTHARLFLAETPTHELVAMLGIDREPGSKVRHAAYIISVFVRPPYRRQHLVDRLLQPALDWAREHDVSLLRLSVTTTNIPAIHCYTRLGFQITGTLEKYIRTPDNALHDEYLMSRPV